MFPLYKKNLIITFFTIKIFAKNQTAMNIQLVAKYLVKTRFPAVLKKAMLHFQSIKLPSKMPDNLIK